QTLPGVRHIMFDHKERWNEHRTYPWEEIKGEWRRHWDLGKPVLVEKSPPNLIRAFDIERCFLPSSFVVMVRNPYAHCEGLIRRNGFSPARAAAFAVKCLRHQRDNVERLGRALLITYEELTTNPERTKARLARFLPELEDISVSEVFTTHHSAE